MDHFFCRKIGFNFEMLLQHGFKINLKFIIVVQLLWSSLEPLLHPIAKTQKENTFWVKEMKLFSIIGKLKQSVLQALHCKAAAQE